MRMSYQRQKEVLEMPNLIEVQKDSYQWFLDEGLKEVFDDISPIADYGGKLSLEFLCFLPFLKALLPVSDLSEDMRKELDNIYQAIAALSVKVPQARKPANPIGFKRSEKGK